MTNQFDELINESADRFDLCRELVRAVVKVESGGNTWLNRYEPHWRYHLDPPGWAKRLTRDGMTTTMVTERVNQSTSWGLMQVMGTVARELGFTGPLPQLADPEIGLHFGCMKLRELIDRHKSDEVALAAYNAGNPESVLGQGYAAKVLALL